jgi:N-acetylmuramoyl-L-alanine amidase
MPTIHTVEQGEFLAKIAGMYGYSDCRAIWDHPENAALKARRKSPNVLFPGDQLFIPDREVKEVPGSTEQRHRFQVKLQRLKLIIFVEDINDEPIADALCFFVIDGDPLPMRTDGAGKVERDITPRARRGELNFTERKIKHQLLIGHLNPIQAEDDPTDPPPQTEDRFSGQRARLNNLGYFAGFDEKNEKQLRWAVEEFQCDQKLKVTGIMDQQTKAKLEEVYGC